MAENRMGMAQLIDVLKARITHCHARNLIFVAMSMNKAHIQGKELAEALNVEYLDFDQEFLALLENDGWDDHVLMEQKGTLSFGRQLAEEWLKDVGGKLNKSLPLVIGNVNLAVRYELDIAKVLYDFTEHGLCILAASGRVR